MYQLRPYQQEAVSAVLQQFETVDSTLLVLPTGTGKTPVACVVIDKYLTEHGGRALFLAHRDELLQQAIDKIKTWTKRSVQLEQADHYVDRLNMPQIVVASVPTLQGKRLQGFDPRAFSLVLTDESHHSAAPTYRNIYNYFEDAQHVGMSVGPASVIELRGSYFGKGWVGTIEEAWGAACLAGAQVKERMGYEIIFFDVVNVESRGWADEGFVWKRAKTLIRHTCDKPTLEMCVAGVGTVLTEDHSVYRAEPGMSVLIDGYRNPKKLAILQDCLSSALSTGDIIPVDDGRGWEDGQELSAPITILDLLERRKTEAKILVAVDTSTLSLETWKSAGVDNRQRYVYKRGKYGGVLPLALYTRLRAQLPSPSLYYYEGAAASIEPTIHLSEWAYMLGYWLGNGWVDNQSGLVGFSVKKSIIDKFTYYLSGLPHVQWNIRLSDKGTGCTEVKACNVFVAEILRATFGKVCAQTKFIPGEWIIAWPEQARHLLLQGLIDSDGHFSQQTRNRDRYVYTTTSQRLANGLLSLLRSLGVVGSLNKKEPTLGGVIKGRQVVEHSLTYRVYWSAAALERNHEKKYGHRQRFSHGNMSFHEGVVRNLCSVEPPQFVYDMEMDGHPSFVANGLLVHNTATPDRSDRKALGAIFESVAYTYDIRDAIEQGYLVQMLFRRVLVEDLDLSRVHTVAGDFIDAELEEQFINEKVLHQVADPLLRLADQRPTLIFSPGVKHAYALAEVINGYRARSAGAIDGKSIDRDQQLRDFREGRIQFLSNMGILTEGVDIPRIAGIANCRPTKSRSLLSQIAGRGFRPYPDKENSLFIDFTDASQRHSLISPVDIMDGNMDLDVKKRAEQLCDEEGLDVLTAMRKAEEQLAEKTRISELEERRKLIAHTSFQTIDVNPLAILGVRPRAGRWGGKEVTVRQKAMLNKAGIPWAGFDCGQASQIIDKIISRQSKGFCTLKMAKTLAKFALSPDVSFEVARKQLDLISQSRWQVNEELRQQLQQMAA